MPCVTLTYDIDLSYCRRYLADNARLARSCVDIPNDYPWFGYKTDSELARGIVEVAILEDFDSIPGIGFPLNDVLDIMLSRWPHFIGEPLHEIVAGFFILKLRDLLSFEEMDAIHERNSTPVYAESCASHDFCDANQLMAQAIQEVGRDPNNSTELWNASWDFARKQL